ncbi:MAG TPA: DNA repair protein RecO [Cyanobacteria bacterium UBA11369]|nr:DNA repair protein RecO [Cyanobacteria bacterium UBA11371]HBE34594.1 DNA repair protein RecO [Cyanobacteria bacterium UBA11368]HBE51038.1 DNA repair protein RecO [Cyanobacteria bacterium UBA11369]
MSRTYKATGINLKSMPLGESDRLLTILTREFGLIRVVAPGARKHLSKLGGRSGLFVVNEYVVAKGRSLDKITQAETLESYPALSTDLLKLSASQYLAEVVIYHALSDHPQEEIFYLLSEHLKRLEQLPKTSGDYRAYLVLAHLAQAVFHLLANAGIAPQVRACCITKSPLEPDNNEPNWSVGFCPSSGGTVKKQGETSSPVSQIQINATELTLLQQLASRSLPQLQLNLGQQEYSYTSWLSVERILRHYTQYHFGRIIRSAALIDNYFDTLPTSEPHAATV